MIFLDTNAIYYSMQISQPDASSKLDIPLLIHEIKTSDNFACSSLTIYEIINHFRKDVDTIKNVFSFMVENKVTLVQNPYIPIKYSLKDLSTIKEQDLNTFLSNDFNLKIEVEARYTLVLLTNMFHINLMMYLKDVAKLEIDKIGQSALLIASEIIAQVGYNILIDTYSVGYKNGNCENEVRIAFYGLLECFTQLLCPLVEQSIMNGQEICIEDITINQKILRKQLQKQPTALKYTQKQATKLSKSNNYSQLLEEYVEGILKSYNSPKLKTSMKTYLQDKSIAMIYRGESFRKNDIVDKMMIDDLTSQDIIYTFDRNLRKFIKENEKEHEEYKNTIEQLKKFGVLSQESI